MNKQKLLADISREIQSCKICKKNTVGETVPGEGDPNATVVFIGEAPGKKESETGRPFVGRSGQILRLLIRSVGLSEKDVFITSPVKRFPVYKTPKPADIAHGKTHLDKQLQIIQPKLIVLLGATAQKALLQKVQPVLTAHGTVIKEGGLTYLLTLHPAAVLRFPKYRPLIEHDFKLIKKLT